MNEIPLSRPDIDEADIAAVVSVLRTPHLSLGPKLLQFEEVFAAYTGTRHAVALSSGTAGLHLALEALNIGPSDEVILPSFTFVAAANAVLYRNAIPVFAEIDPLSLNITAETIRAALTLKTRAILLVHTFGHPADMDPILELAQKHKLFLIEDACEATGAEYKGKKVGGFGDFGVFSFYPNKPITTGEGGVLVTNNTAHVPTIRALRNQGRRETDGWLDHALLGYNYRLPELSCALGISQLSRIESILQQRESVAKRYQQALLDCPRVTPSAMLAENGRICWFAYPVRVPHRDHVVRHLTSNGIGCRAYFPPIHRQPLFAPYARAPLPITEQVASSTLALPFFNAITDAQIDRVCTELNRAL